VRSVRVDRTRGRRGRRWLASGDGGVLARRRRSHRGRGRRWGRLVGRRHLNLTIGNLRDDAAAGDGSLDLSIVDLRDLASRVRGSLDLTIGNLADDRRRSRLVGARRGLNLTVGNLSNGRRSGLGRRRAAALGRGSRLVGACRCLDLTVGNLSHRRRSGLVGTSRSLDLSVGDLANSRSTESRARLARRAAGATRGDDADRDRLALGRPVTVIQVIEVARAALVERGGGSQGQQVVLADGEASGVDGTSLGGAVELELVVGGDVSGAGLGVLEDTVVEGNQQRAAILAFLLKPCQPCVPVSYPPRHGSPLPPLG
jgi:hypothetical protein